MTEASLAGKTILMSGGSRGICLAIALRAARDGANIALIAKTDTPHPIDGADGETLTAALLWVAQSHTGDYHDNARSNRQHKRGVL